MARGRKITRIIELEERTLGAAAAEFYKNNLIKGLSKETQKAYKIYVDNFVSWYGADELLADVTSATFEDYIIKKQEDGNKPVSIATTMRHLRRFVKFCEEREYIGQIEIIIPKYEQELKEPYSNDEMEKLLKRPTSNNWVEWRNWCMVNYFFATGQRLSTVLNIKVEHLDLEGARVKLEWNKDKIQKYMPLSSAIVRVLKEYIELSRLEPQDYLFPEYEGKQLKKNSAEDTIANYNRKRGVSKTSIHLFRHTFAKNYIINGGNAIKLQKLLNHKTLDMTMKYVNLYGQDIASDLDLLNPLDVFKRENYTPTKRRVV